MIGSASGNFWKSFHTLGERLYRTWPVWEGAERRGARTQFVGACRAVSWLVAYSLPHDFARRWLRSRRRWSGLRDRRLDANADSKTRLAKAHVVSEQHQRTIVDRQRAREMNRIEAPDVIEFARDVDHDGADRNHIKARKQGCGNTDRRRIESPCCLKKFNACQRARNFWQVNSFEQPSRQCIGLGLPTNQFE